MSIGQASFDIVPNMAALRADMHKVTDEVTKTMKHIESQVEKEQKGIWSAFSMSGDVGKILKGAGIATGLYQLTSTVKNLGMSAVSAFMDWEFSMTTVQAKSFATNKELERMKELTLDLATTSLYSARQQADALKILVEMGLSATQAMSALPSIINLATTEQMGLAHAADVALGIVRGFGMEVGELNRVNDVLAYTAAKSASSIFSIGQAMKVAASTGALSGQSLEDISATVGGLSNRMIRAEAAGYAVTQMIARFTRAWQSSRSVVDETGSTLGKARQVLKTLSIDLMTTEKVLKPLPQLFEEFAKAGITTAQSIDLMGVYTYRNFIAAVKAWPEIKRLKEETTGWGNAAQGVADKIAELQKNTLLGHVKQLGNEFEVLGIRVGIDFKNSAIIFIDAVKLITDSVNTLLKLSKEAAVFLDKKGISNPAWQPWQLYTKAVDAAYNSVYKFFTEFNWTGFMKQEEGLWKKQTESINEYRNSLARMKSVFPILDALKHYGVTNAQPGYYLGETKKSTFSMPNPQEYEAQVSKIHEIQKKMYGAMKTMTIEHYRFERQEMLDLAETELRETQKLIDLDYEIRMSAIRSRGLTVTQFDKEEKEAALVRTEALLDAQSDYEIYTAIRTQELLNSFVEKNSRAGIEAANKERAESVAMAESYSRLTAGMKETSNEYYDWKEKALREQYDKELIIVEKSEEGKLLLEKWYEEQSKQLMYSRLLRLGTFSEGMGVAVDKIKDIGMNMGTEGEQFFNDIVNIGEDTLSAGFQSITDITDDWSTTMLEIIKNMADSILATISDLIAKLIIKWAIMSALGAGTSGAGSFNTGTGNYEGIGTSNTLFSNLGSTGKSFSQAPMTSSSPFSSSNTMSVSRGGRGDKFNQYIEIKIDATDPVSFKRMLRNEGAGEIQRVMKDAVDNSRGYAANIRGRAK